MMQVDATLISSHPQHAAADLDSVRGFLEVHGSALADFAYILGGESATPIENSGTPGGLAHKLPIDPGR